MNHSSTRIEARSRPTPLRSPRPAARRIGRWFALLTTATMVLVACTETLVPSGPTISSFAADPAFVEPGQSTTLTWQVAGADTVTLLPGSVDVTGGTSFVVAPDAATTFTLVAANATGSASASVTIPVGFAPTIGQFRTQPDLTVNPGLPATLVWTVTGADALELRGPGLGDGVDVTGATSFDVATTPAGAVYTLAAINVIGTVTSDVLASRAVPAFTALIAGQSNAQGVNVGPLAALAFIAAEPTVQMFGNDYVWKSAFEPLDDCVNQVDQVSRDPKLGSCTTLDDNDSGVSSGSSLGNGVTAATGGTVFLVPAALGGSGVTAWLPQADRYDRSTLFGSAAHRARLADQQRSAPLGHEFDGASFGALVWYQGETDSASSGLVSSFATRTRTVLSAFRDELGAPNLLVQLSRRGPAELTDGVDRNLSYQRVREIQRRLATDARLPTASGQPAPDTLERTYLVVTHDLPMHPGDGRHLSAAGQVELGRRLSLAVREHLFGEPNVDGSGPQLVAVVKDPNNSVVRVQTDRPITTTTSNYSGYFAVFSNGAPVAVSSVQRDPADSKVVRIVLSGAVAGPVEVRYMPPPGIITALAPDVVRSATCDEPIPTDIAATANLCLPMAAFGDAMDGAAMSRMSVFSEENELE